jgi:predicted RNase H-like HicB family nuclease
MVALRRIYEILDYQENREDGSSIAEYPFLPGCVSQRKTHEALANRRDAIGGILKVRGQYGLSIPAIAVVKVEVLA